MNSLLISHHLTWEPPITEFPEKIVDFIVKLLADAARYNIIFRALFDDRIPTTEQFAGLLTAARYG
mgnify:FL=1